MSVGLTTDGPEMVAVRSACKVLFKVSVALLFADTGSTVADDSIAKVIGADGADATFTTMTNVASVAFAMEAIVQRLVAISNVPELGAAETIVKPAGSASLATIVCAVSGPKFCRRAVNVTGCPTTGFVLLAVMDAARSAAVAVTLRRLWLLAVLRSAVSAVTATERLNPALLFTTKSSVADAMK